MLVTVVIVLEAVPVDLDINALISAALNALPSIIVTSDIEPINAMYGNVNQTKHASAHELVEERDLEKTYRS